MVLSLVIKLHSISLARICALWTTEEICRLNVSFESKMIPRSRVSLDQFSWLLSNI